MLLSVKDVCRLLNAPERTIFRWIKAGSLPATKVGDDWRINRVELMEWATRERISISPEIFQADDPDDARLSVAAALREGGVHTGIGGADKEAAIRSVVDRLRLPPAVDRALLVSVLVARESLGSTGIGNGIAIPHARNPLVLEITRPQIALCHLDRPVDFGALDGRPVTVIFAMLCPTVRVHLRLLSRLAFVLKDAEFRAALEARPPLEQILPMVERLEARIPAARGEGGGGGAGDDEAPPAGGRLTRF